MSLVDTNEKAWFPPDLLAVNPITHPCKQKQTQSRGKKETKETGIMQ
jgi:hypothetical protein